MFWIFEARTLSTQPAKPPGPQSRTVPWGQVHRHMLLRGLAEEIVYEDSVAQRYAGLLAAVICDGNPTAKREYEHMLAQERQRAKSFGAIGNPLATFEARVRLHGFSEVRQ